MKEARVKRGPFDVLDFFPENPEHDEFSMWLGRFVQMYASVEVALIAVLIRYSKSPLPIAKALFARERPESAMSDIRRIIRARRLRGPKVVELLALFDQIGIILRVRNDLLHLGMSYADNDATRREKKIISNALFAYSPKVVTEIPISKEILKAMYLDLFEIGLRLMAHMGMRPKISLSQIRQSKLEFPEGKPGRAIFVRTVLKLFRIGRPFSQLPAWRYRPPVKVRRRRKHRGPPQAHAPQPTPSRA
jgi:hypothetical protein